VDPNERTRLEALLTIYLTNLHRHELRIAQAGGPDAAPVALLNETEATRAMIAEINAKLAPQRVSYEELEAIGSAGQAQIILAWLKAQDHRFETFAASQRRRETWMIVILIVMGVVLVIVAAAAAAALGRGFAV
jgi:hypothetical protein